MHSVNDMIARALAEAEEQTKLAEATGRGLDEEATQEPETTTETVSDVEAEKMAAALEFIGGNLNSVIDDRSPAEKLAELALLNDELAKRASAPGSTSVEIDESGVSGEQPEVHDHSRTGNIPEVTGSESPRKGSPATLGETNMSSPPGGSESWAEKAPLQKAAGEETTRSQAAEILSALGVGQPHVKVAEQQEAEVVEIRDFLLSKLAEDVNNMGAGSPSLGGGGNGGGEYFASASEEGPTAPAPRGEKGVGSNEAAIDLTKRDAKSDPKSELGQLLSEPALTSATDSTLRQHLSHAAEAGAKIAADAEAAKEALKKVAGEGCVCDSQGSCGFCILRSAVASVKQASCECDGTCSTCQHTSEVSA